MVFQKLRNLMPPDDERIDEYTTTNKTISKSTYVKRCDSMDGLAQVDSFINRWRWAGMVHYGPDGWFVTQNIDQAIVSSRPEFIDGL